MYYAGRNRYGINFVIAKNQGWEAYVFDTKKERDDWVNAHEYCPDLNSNYIACTITRKEAYKIISVRDEHEYYVEMNHDAPQMYRKW